MRRRWRRGLGRGFEGVNKYGMKGGGMKRYSATELQARRARGESLSDLARVRQKSEAELVADIAGDNDFRDVPKDWCITAQAVIPAAGG